MRLVELKRSVPVPRFSVPFSRRYRQKTSGRESKWRTPVTSRPIGENRPYLGNASTQRAQIWVRGSRGGPRPNPRPAGLGDAPCGIAAGWGPRLWTALARAPGRVGPRGWARWKGPVGPRRTTPVRGRSVRDPPRCEPTKVAPSTGPGSLARGPRSSGVGSLDGPPRDLDDETSTRFFRPAVPEIFTKNENERPETTGTLRGRGSGTRPPRGAKLGSERHLGGPLPTSPPPSPGAPRSRRKGAPQNEARLGRKGPGAPGRRGPRGPGGTPRHPKGRAAGTSPSRDTGLFVRKSLALDRAPLGTGRAQRLGTPGVGCPRGDAASPAVPSPGDLPVPRYGHFLSSFDRA